MLEKVFIINSIEIIQRIELEGGLLARKNLEVVSRTSSKLITPL